MTDPLPPRPALPRIWIVAGLAALSLIAVFATGLWHLRRETLTSQARELSVLSLALADELDRGLQSVEIGMQAVRLELRVGELLPDADTPVRQRYPHDLKLPLASQLWIIDRRGNLLAASSPALSPDPNSFSPGLKTLNDTDTALSRPFRDFASGQPSIALAVRYNDHQGALGGWLIAALPVEALRGAFSQASPAADARMAVFRSDGVRLAGSLADQPASTTAAELLLPGQEQRHGVAVLNDGRQRLVAQRQLQRFGLELVLTRDIEAALAPWRDVAWFGSSGLLLLLAGLAAAAHRIARAEQRRMDSQAALQTQLSRTNKLESLGTLAGGVAHDFNNVLAAVLGYAEMARQSATDGSRQARQLDHVLQAALRGKSLVERILSFSRSGARSATVFEVQPVIDEVLGLLAASLRQGVVLESRFEAPGVRLNGDPTQVFEAVMNLCTNAMQAMPDGGRLVVSTARHAARTAETVSHGQIEPGDYLALSVSDEGAGIAATVMEHLFEPFFTTRRQHAGTGLGLAVVHGVVAEFGGAIDVQSVAGQGARFTLYLPESKGEPAAAPATTLDTPIGNGQTLMVVDDESALVELAEELLAELGYEPVGYTDPQAALDALRNEPDRYDALLTDEVMPTMSGTQLTEALRAFAPHLPVLLVSGYGGPQLAARAVAVGVTRVLAKPLRRAELAQALDQLLRVTPPAN
ncbi:MAG: response regulator [Burkholderiaceae bacterium]|nr:response regulator [Burkholderiaceae bacterium]